MQIETDKDFRANMPGIKVFIIKRITSNFDIKKTEVSILPFDICELEFDKKAGILLLKCKDAVDVEHNLVGGL
jgi:hypothetical protein